MAIDTEDDFVSFIDDENGETEVQVGKPEKTATNTDSDARLARAEAEQHQLRSQLSNLQNQQHQPQQQQHDSYAGELDNISEQEKALGIQFEALRASKGLDKATIDDFDKKARNLQQRRIDISTQRTMQNIVPQLLSAQQQQHYRTQYADVHADERARTYAQARYNMLLSLGETDSPQLVDRAMNDARIQFKMPGSTKLSPTDQDRRQMSGVGGGGRATNTNTVRMGKPEKAMAMALYSKVVNGDEKKAYAMWAKGPGARAAKEISKGKRG